MESKQFNLLLFTNQNLMWLGWLNGSLFIILVDLYNTKRFCGMHHEWKKWPVAVFWYENQSPYLTSCLKIAVGVTDKWERILKYFEKGHGLPHCKYRSTKSNSSFYVQFSTNEFSILFFSISLFTRTHTTNQIKTFFMLHFQNNKFLFFVTFYLSSLPYYERECMERKCSRMLKLCKKAQNNQCLLC